MTSKSKQMDRGKVVPLTIPKPTPEKLAQWKANINKMIQIMNTEMYIAENEMMDTVKSPADLRNLAAITLRNVDALNWCVAVAKARGFLPETGIPGATQADEEKPEEDEEA